MTDLKESVGEERVIDKIKLKPVWALLVACIAYMFLRQGWDALVAIDAMVIKATAVSIGALVGLMVDARHFYMWPPKSEDPDYENRRRRVYFIIAGMLAMALSV